MPFHRFRRMTKLVHDIQRKQIIVGIYPHKRAEAVSPPV
jgi:hypothetical protein